MTNPDLAQRLSEAIAAAEPGLEQRMESDPAAYLDLVVLTAEADAHVGELLDAAVSSARTAGHSWEAIGQALRMSRQAAQQRFGRDRAVPAAPPGQSRRLSPLTAFNEMDVLDRAGTFGWHSVAFGPLYHVVVKSEEQWEHRRVSVIGANRHQLEAEGWQRIGSMWFPWAYYARPTGRPALAEPVSEDHLLSRWSGKPSTTAGGKAERGDA